MCWDRNILQVIIIFDRKLTMGRFFVLKAIYEVLLENPSAEYVEKRLVVDQIELYPESDKKNLRMIWAPRTLNNIIIKLEEFGLVKSYNVWEKPPKKMLKITKMGKELIKSEGTIHNFHKLKKKK